MLSGLLVSWLYSLMPQLLKLTKDDDPQKTDNRKRTYFGEKDYETDCALDTFCRFFKAWR